MSLSNKLWAIVPAAGVGSRMQREVPKQYLSVAGKTVIEHTLERLLECEQLEGIVVCLSPSDGRFPELAIAQRSAIETTLGGDTRAQSVLNGLAAIEGQVSEDDWVLVHDAARPCISSASIAHLLHQTKEDKVGGILALPAKDTLKQALADQAVVSQTLDRSLVWQAQTPQMFRYGLLADSLRRALDLNVEITDEASALEWAGHRVKLIEGSARNIKITTPDDLALAEFLLTMEEHDQ